MPRFHVSLDLQPGAELILPASVARHVQVLRLQPGEALTLFNGQGGQWQARVLRMGRSEVVVTLGEFEPVERELATQVTLAVGMPANERMDWLVEKATELGVAGIQPLVCERSVLRLSGERAERKVSHWQAVAVAAAEQSGRTRVPEVAAVRSLREWLGALPAAAGTDRLLLSPAAAELPARAALAARVCCLSGPEGGLSPAEEAQAVAAGFLPAGLGPRILRADTAPLATLAWIALTA